MQEYFQPKIGRKIRVFSLGWKNIILIKKKKTERECNASAHRGKRSARTRMKTNRKFRIKWILRDVFIPHESFH